MNLKEFKTIIKGHELDVVFPNKKVLILIGLNSNNVIYRIESLLANDYLEYYKKEDAQYGFDYEPFDNISHLSCQK